MSAVGKVSNLLATLKATRVCVCRNFYQETFYSVIYFEFLSNHVICSLNFIFFLLTRTSYLSSIFIATKYLECKLFNLDKKYIIFSFPKDMGLKTYQSDRISQRIKSPNLPKLSLLRICFRVMTRLHFIPSLLTASSFHS
jgi:hypothetical protein